MRWLFVTQAPTNPRMPTDQRTDRYSHLRLEFREVDEQAARVPLPNKFTRTKSWSKGGSKRSVVRRSREAKRANNAAANAALLGGQLRQ